jgi:nucleotide-binding universal stress UspA family protein
VVVVFGYGVWPGGSEDRDYIAALEQMGEEATAEAVSLLLAQGIDARAELVRAKPADALLRAAEAHAASLIVVGTHGEHAITGALLGSVPHKLVQRSPVPVLVVPATT